MIHSFHHRATWVVGSGGSGQAFGFGPPFHIVADTNHPAYPSNLSQCVLDGERRERNKEAKLQTCFVVFIVAVLAAQVTHRDRWWLLLQWRCLLCHIVVTAPVLPLHAHVAMRSGPTQKLIADMFYAYRERGSCSVKKMRSLVSLGS